MAVVGELPLFHKLPKWWKVFGKAATSLRLLVRGTKLCYVIKVYSRKVTKRYGLIILPYLAG